MVIELISNYKVRVCETCYEKQQNKLASLPKDTQGQPKINSESSAQAQKEAEVTLA
jgi:hypothetical protein